jgi:predicted PurR-regulated permease PerM/quinol monooxygenase YgiN
MAFRGRRALNVLCMILLFAVGLAIVYVARGVLVIFIFSILFAYLIDPFVRFLQRHSFMFRNLRGPHVAAAYLYLLILIPLVIHLVAPGSLGKTTKLVKQIPSLVAGITSGEIVTQIGEQYAWSEPQQQRLKSLLIEHQASIEGAAGGWERSAFSALAGMVVIPILAIFFLSDGANMVDSVIRMVATKDNLEQLQFLTRELNSMLHHYIRAKVTLAGLSLVFFSLATLLLRFPHFLALGLLAGTLEFIPVAGWMISAVTIISIGAMTHAHWIWMAALIGLWRMLMDYWISPRVMGHELEIHPVMAIFAVMVGGAIGGIVGIYLSVPLVAVLRVLWRTYARLRPHAAAEVSHVKNERVIRLLQVKVLPQYRDEILQATRENRLPTSAEAGVEAYYQTRRKDDPNAFIFFRVFSSQAAYDSHVQKEYAERIFAAFQGKLAEEPIRAELVELD